MELDPGKRTPRTEPVAPHVQTAPVTVKVLPLGDHDLTFDPDIAKIKPHGWVIWDVSEVPIPAGGSVVIEFTDVLNNKKGPFPQDTSDDHNPERGKYKWKKGHPGEHPIKTAPEDQGMNPPQGHWKYEFTVFDAAGKQERFADPGVQIIEGPGIGGGKEN
jgi:hypothetical protein